VVEGASPSTLRFRRMRNGAFRAPSTILRELGWSPFPAFAGQDC